MFTNVACIDFVVMVPIIVVIFLSYGIAAIIRSSSLFFSVTAKSSNKYEAERKQNKTYLIRSSGIISLLGGTLILTAFVEYTQPANMFNDVVCMIAASVFFGWIMVGIIWDRDM